MATPIVSKAVVASSISAISSGLSTTMPVGSSEVPQVPASQLNAKDAEIEKLKLQLIEERHNVATANERIKRLQSLMEDSSLIVLRSPQRVISVLADGVRHQFTNYLYKTADRMLANSILAQYPNIVEVKHESVL